MPTSDVWHMIMVLIEAKLALFGLWAKAKRHRGEGYLQSLEVNVSPSVHSANFFSLQLS